MNSLFHTFLVLLSVTYFSSVCATVLPLLQCPGYNFDNFQDRISIDPCSESRCKLPKEHNITVIFRFKPDKPVITLTNKVSATIGSVLTLPFPGTDGTSACQNIYNAEDKSPAPCPLTAGKEYIYKNIIYTQSFFPEIDLTVNWSLDDQNNKSVMCFMVPARITKKIPKKNKGAKKSSSP